MGSRTDKYHANASFTSGSTSNVNYAAFLLSLVNRVGQEKTLASGDCGFDGDQTTVFVRVDREHLFMKGLFFDIGTVDQQRHSMQVPEFFAAVPAVSQARCFGRRARVTTASFGLSKLFPDSAQGRLPSDGG
jgi:hypothetical protein